MLVKTTISAVSVTGTDTTFTKNNYPVPNGLNYVDFSETNRQLQSTVALKSKPSIVQSSGEVSRERRNVLLRVPVNIGTAESPEYDTVNVRVDVDFGRDIANATVTEALRRMADFCSRSGNDTFWLNGVTDVS